MAGALCKSMACRVLEVRAEVLQASSSDALRMTGTKPRVPLRGFGDFDVAVGAGEAKLTAAVADGAVQGITAEAACRS